MEGKAVGSSARLGKEASDPIIPISIFLRTSKNPSGGSFGAIVRSENIVWAFGGRDPALSNNAMELVGTERTLNCIDERFGPSSIRLIASQYVSGGLEFLPTWEKQGWKRCGGVNMLKKVKGRIAVANIEIWQAIDAAVRMHRSVEVLTLPTPTTDVDFGQAEREAAFTIAQRVGLGGIIWRDITSGARSAFDLSKLSPNNDNA